MLKSSQPFSIADEMLLMRILQSPDRSMRIVHVQLACRILYSLHAATKFKQDGRPQGRRFHVSWNLNGRRTRRIVASREAREHKLISKPPLYAVLKYMAPLVLTLVTLRYQGKTEGLFEENPVPSWSFLVTTCVYGLIGGGMDQIQTLESKWSQIFRRVALASGVFSMVSLVSIFLPYPVSIVPLIICIVLRSAVLAWPTLCRACSLIHGGITSVLDNIRAKLGNLTEEATEEAPSLV